ncbi:hypothetical protein ACS3SW_07240 [Roseobacteraceae bacterium S113]
MARKRVSPREKKALSYAKDRREDFGQNDKASRRLVPLRKAQSNRQVRRAGQHLLAEDADAAQAAFERAQKRRFRKCAGSALGDHVTRQTKRRVDGHGAKAKRSAARKAFYIEYKELFGIENDHD